MGQGRRPTRAFNGVLVATAMSAMLGLVPWLGKSLFRDEGASLYSANLTWAALWRQSRVVDLVLLPYYAILHLWIQFSGSIQWIRSLSLLAFGLTIFLIGRVGFRLGGSVCGVLAAVLGATNPLMISAALDARPYELSALACTAAVIALIRWLDGGSIRWIWWFCLASTIAVLLQMFSILAPLSALGVAIVLRPQMFREQWRRLTAPIGILLVVVTSFAVVAAPQVGQISWIHLNPHVRPVVDALLGPAYNGGKRYTAVVGVVVLAGIGLCGLAWRRRHFRPTRRELGYFTISVAWAALPAMALVAASFVRPVYAPRYVTASVPGLALVIALLVARGFDQTAVGWTDRSRLVVGATALVVAALVIISTSSLQAARYFSENFVGVAQYLHVSVGEEGSAALPDHSLTTSIDYYLRMDHERVRMWPQLAEQPYVDGLDLRQDHRALARGSDGVWLVVVDSKFPRTSGFIATLEHDRYSWVGTARFRGVQVLHFRRRVGSTDPSRTGAED